MELIPCLRSFSISNFETRASGSSFGVSESPMVKVCASALSMISIESRGFTSISLVGCQAVRLIVDLYAPNA